MCGVNRLAWAYLSRVAEPPHRGIAEWLQDGKSAEEIARGIKNRESWIGASLLDHTESRYRYDEAERDLERAEECGARLVTPEDKEWPGELLNQAFHFARVAGGEHISRYTAMASAPYALWVKGNPLNTLFAQAVAVVGSRAMSKYGYEATRMIVGELVPHHWTIVSGGAFGVDTTAHEKTLELGGETAVVMAGGIDRVYPARNRRLFEKICSQGVLISEYPPGYDPQRHRFLARNRLVAALTAGTVVIEAAYRSGALNTLAWANALGRVAMAVPGPVTTVGSTGCHRKIRDGVANIVTTGDDIRELLSRVGSVDPDQQLELDFSPSVVQQLSINELKIFDAISPEGTTAERIAEASGLPIALSVHLLYDMQKRGVIDRVGNNWIRRRE